MRKLFLLAALTLCAAPAASAQTTWHVGLRGGGNWATTTLDEASNAAPTSRESHNAAKTGIVGGQAGVVLAARFGKLALQPGLLLTQRGQQMQTSSSLNAFGFRSQHETVSTTRSNWLELPLHIIYTLNATRGPQVLAGPYLARAVGGRQKGTETHATSALYPLPSTQEFDRPIDYRPDGFNERWDAGFDIGAGYQLGPWQLQLVYSIGVVNLHRADTRSYYDYHHHTFEADPAYNRVARLTAAYFWGSH